MVTSPPEFTDMRIRISEGKIEHIKDEHNGGTSNVDQADIPKIKRDGTLIATIYKYQFNPICTVVIRSDGTAVKICR